MLVRMCTSLKLHNLLMKHINNRGDAYSSLEAHLLFITLSNFTRVKIACQVLPVQLLAIKLSNFNFEFYKKDLLMGYQQTVGLSYVKSLKKH